MQRTMEHFEKDESFRPLKGFQDVRYNVEMESLTHQKKVVLSVCGADDVDNDFRDSDFVSFLHPLSLGSCLYSWKMHFELQYWSVLYCLRCIFPLTMRFRSLLDPQNQIQHQNHDHCHCYCCCSCCCDFWYCYCYDGGGGGGGDGFWFQVQVGLETQSLSYSLFPMTMKAYILASVVIVEIVKSDSYDQDFELVLMVWLLPMLMQMLMQMQMLWLRCEMGIAGIVECIRKVI